MCSSDLDHIFYLKNKNNVEINDISQVYGISFLDGKIDKNIEFSIKNPNYNSKFIGD